MKRPGFWYQAREIARKDLIVEGRAGEALYITVPFGAVALMLIPLAVGTDKPLLATIGPGMYLAVSLLFGMLVAFRQTATDDASQRELLALLGTDPAAKFVGRAATSLLLMLVFSAVLVPVTILLYNPGRIEGWPWLILVIGLLASGLAMVGTLAGSVTAGLKTRSTLTPLLVAPLAMPMLLAAGQVLEALRDGSSILAWIVLLITTNLAMAAIGVATAEALEESSS
ncbi:MAG: heme exporter protein CcmB [Acidimicrobiia bacterium]|nr:heme exporter protein CcmB [Acidimicrobiia bacterium]MBT8214762.1 heme exporter protein CcmB [Acidimicrobiia bacterium]NNF68559.1 ABC transporter permease [Acidimicrobiia bacterium]NNK91252.1 ABC transporter permease [Acidimicrobiia bacterium]